MDCGDMSLSVGKLCDRIDPEGIDICYIRINLKEGRIDQIHDFHRIFDC